MTTVSEIDVKVGLHDEGVIAGLHRISAEVDKTAAEMKGKEAEIAITGNLRDFKRKLREAEALEREHQRNITKLEKERDKLSGAQKGAATRRIKQEQALLTTLQKELPALRARGRAMDDYASTLRTTNKLEAAGAAERAKAARAEKQAVNERTRDLRAQQREQDRLQRTEMQRLRARGEAAAMMRKEMAERITGSAKEEAAVARLQQRYATLYEKQAKLDRAPGRFKTLRRAIDPTLNAKIEFDQSQVARQLAEVEAELRVWGREPITKHIDLQIDDDQHRGAGMLSRWAKALTETTVRVGPFTTTILGMVRALSLLGPIIVGLVGQLGALASVVGGGLVGALGVAAAGVGGFALAAGGIFAIMKPLAKDFMDAKKATDAYNKAVREHGKDSKEAAKKLDILNHVMGDVPEQTRKQYIALGGLNQRWKDLTSSAKPEFWHLTGEAIQTVSDIMPMFAKRSTTAFQVASRGVEDWMRSLRSSSGQSVIGDLMGNFTKALPNILHGLGNLGAALGHIGVSFGRWLPDLTEGFDHWSGGLLKGTQNVAKLNSGADSLVGAMRSVGHVTAAAGRVLAAFFGAGLGSGTSMLERWASGLNGLAASMRTVSGQRSIKKFFDESISTANKFWAALKPIGQIFFEWSTLMRPFTDAMLVAIRIIGQVVQAISSFGPVRGILQTAFTLFLTGALIGKISAVATAISGLARAMLGLKAASAATAAVGKGGFLAGTTARVNAARGAGAAATAEQAIAARGMTGVGVAGAARGAANVEKTAVAMSRGARAAGALRTGLTGVGAVLGVANPLFGAAALAATGAALAYMHFHKSSDAAKKALAQAGAATDQTAAAYRAVAGSLAGTISEHERATISVRQAREELSHAKKGTDEYKLAQLNLRDAQRYAIQTGQAVTSQRKEDVRLAGEQITKQKDELKAFDKLNESRRKSLQSQLDQHKGTPFEGSTADLAKQRELDKLNARRAQLVNQVTMAQNRQAASYANIARAAAGMLPVLGTAEQKLGALARLSKKASVKVALKFQDPGDVSKVAASASRALRSGTPTRIVTRIVADSKSAEEAVRRINATRLTAKKLSIIETGGKRAVAVMEQIIGRKLGKKEVAIAQRGGAVALAMMNVLSGYKINDKHPQIIARDRASAVIAGIIGLLAGVHDKTATVRYTEIVSKKRSGNAGGRRPGAVASAANALVGEGRRGTGATEFIADHATGLVKRVDSPTILKLKDSESVIPTEPAYAHAGRARLSEFAKSMGIPGFARSRRAKLLKKLRPAGKDGPGRLPEVREYKKLQDDEDAQNALIEQAQAAIREPEDWVVPTGKKDANGEPLYGPNQPAIDAYNISLGNWIKRQEELFNPDNNTGILAQLLAQFDPTIGALDHFESFHQRNVDALNGLIGLDRKLVNQTVKGKHTEKAKRAEKRMNRNIKRRDKEAGWVTDAKGIESDVRDDNGGLKRRRLPEAAQDLSDERYQRDVTTPRAISDAMTSVNPKPDSAQPDVGLSYATSPGVQKALTDTVLAGIVKEFGGNANPNVKGIKGPGSPGGAQGLVTNPANIPLGKLLSGAGPGGALASLTTSSAATAGAAAGAAVASGAVGSGSRASAVSGSLNAAERAPVSSGVVEGGGGGVTKQVNITNHFLTQPADPLTWTKGVEFEAGALI